MWAWRPPRSRHPPGSRHPPRTRSHRSRHPPEQASPPFAGGKKIISNIGNLGASSPGSIHTSNLLGVNYCVNFSLNNGLFIAQVPKTCCKISNDDPLNPEISTDDYDRCQLHAERQVDSSDILWTTVSTYTPPTHARIDFLSEVAPASKRESMPNFSLNIKIKFIS